MRLWRYVVIVLMLGLSAYNGLLEGTNAVRFATTPGMKIATATQLLYGVAAACALAVMLMRRQLVPMLLVAWAAGLIITGALAPVVYGGTSIAVGLAGGALMAAVVVLVTWAWRGIDHA